MGGIDTKLNLHKGKGVDIMRLKDRYIELTTSNFKKMEIYRILGYDFCLSEKYVSKIIGNN